MQADQTTSNEVANVLTSVFTLHTERKTEEIMALFSPDADVYLIGTAVGDRRMGQKAIREQLVSDFSDSGDYTFELQNLLVSTSGNIAWVAADAVHHNTVGGKRVESSARLTAVLENRDGKWLICQWHKSRPYNSD